MKVLITGAGGYIGSIACYLFLQHGYEVVGIDNFSRGYRQPLDILIKKYSKEKFRYYKQDLLDDKLSCIFAKEKRISSVIHYAALCLVDESVKNPDLYFKNNVCGSINLLNNIKTNKIKNIVFSSTCAVYGEAKYSPIDEKHPTDPVNPYGESKRMIEKVIEWYSSAFGLNFVIFRYFNVCGASDDGLFGDSKKPSTLLVQNSVRGALGIDKFYLTCPIVNTPDKTPIRDYINVIDLNVAHIKACEYLKDSGKSQIFNLGTENGSSVFEIIDQVRKMTKKTFKLNKTKPRLGEYAKTIANTNKAKKVLKWQNQHSLEDSIKSLTLWYQKHPKGWRY